MFTSLRTRASPLLTPHVARVTVVMCGLFAGYGIVLPFLARWLEVERHLDGAQIGAVLSMPQLTRIVVGPLIAFWADGAADRRTAVRVLSAVSVVAFVVFFFVARDLPSLIFFGFVALTCSQALSPFVEGAVLRACDQGRISYGFARAFGSAAFIIANVLGGISIARFGLGAVIVWVLATYGSMTLAAWRTLKPDPAPHEGRADLGQRLSTSLTLLRAPRFLILIVACGLIQSAHAFYYGFSTLVWRSQGVAPETIGLLWGCGGTAEVLFLLSLPLVERRLRPEALIMVGGAGGALRWVFLGLAPIGPVLWPIQAMHALSFAAAHVGAMRLLYRESPQAAAGLAQTVYAALASGLFIGLSTLLSGVLYDAIGAHGYWAMAAIAASGAALSALLLVFKAKPGANPL